MIYISTEVEIRLASFLSTIKRRPPAPLRNSCFCHDVFEIISFTVVLASPYPPERSCYVTTARTAGWQDLLAPPKLQHRFLRQRTV